LRDLPAAHSAGVGPRLEAALEWLRQTQNGDGSWGFFGQPTEEETAYAVLALTGGERSQVPAVDRRRCQRAWRYLRAAAGSHAFGEEHAYQPLWIDKCLYTPTLIVRAVIEAARIALSGLVEKAGGTDHAG
jgi:halimadienyl-diphosphate synthase